MIHQMKSRVEDDDDDDRLSEQCYRACTSSALPPPVPFDHLAAAVRKDTFVVVTTRMAKCVQREIFHVIVDGVHAVDDSGALLVWARRIECAAPCITSFSPSPRFVYQLWRSDN